MTKPPKQTTKELRAIHEAEAIRWKEEAKEREKAKT